MRRALLLLLALLVAAPGCSDDTPRSDYDDFRERTRERRENACIPSGPPESRYSDVNGRWFVYALLATGIELGLRVELSGGSGTPPEELAARFWLDRHDPDTDPPIAEVVTQVDEQGHFVLEADLTLPADLLGGDTDVEASVVMDVATIADDAWCGSATGNVTVPIVIDLAGSTFYATRDPDDMLQKGDVPFKCPSDDCGGGTEPDAEAPPVGDGGVPLDGGTPRPPSPDLSDVPSVRRDLTGHYLFHARLAGAVALRLWLSILYAEAPAPNGGVTAFLEGSLRREADAPGTPPLINFSADVGPDGTFEIWLPGLSLESPLGQVNADILLTSATLERGFCGRANGAVRTPIMLDLAGTEFAVTPWTPGTEQPDPLPRSCAEAIELIEGGPAPDPDAGAPSPDAAPMPDAGAPPPDAGAADGG